MPYIKQEDRKKYDKILILLRKMPYLTTGELNYLITKIIDGQIGENPNYQTYNDLIGVLECVKQELYRRVISPYEDFKKTTNSDVYTNREYWKRIK